MQLSLLSRLLPAPSRVPLRVSSVGVHLHRLFAPAPPSMPPRKQPKAGAATRQHAAASTVEAAREGAAAVLNGISPGAEPQRRRRTSGVTDTAANGAALSVPRTPGSSAGKGRRGRTVPATASAAVCFSATAAEPIDALPANGHVTSAERSDGPAAPPADAPGVEVEGVMLPSSAGRKPAAKRASKAAAAAGAGHTDASAPGEAAPLPKAKRSRKAPAAAMENGAEKNGAHAPATADGNDEPSSAKPKAKRGKKAKAAPVAADGEASPAKPKAKRRKKTDTMAAGADGAARGDADAGEAAAAKPKKKRTPKVMWPPGPLYHHGMRPEPHSGPSFKVLSWNVAGLRALLNKDPESLTKLIAMENPDVICLQETKLQDKHVEEVDARLGLPEGWSTVFNCSQTLKGYSGTAVLSRQRPLSMHLGIGRDEHDQEGRVVTAEFERLFVVSVYVPNSGEGLRRLEYRVGKWDRDLAAYLKTLRERKPIVVCGDLNCAHQEIDIHSPKTNLRSAGFTVEERDSFTTVILGGGLIDCFRRQHPGIVAYSYYGYRMNMRAKGKGWRLDYNLVSDDLLPHVHDCYIMHEYPGSDHCPCGIIIKQ